MGGIGDKIEIKEVQEWCCDYGYPIVIDGKFGSETKRALIKILQNEMNKQFGANLKVDGVFGPASISAWHTLGKGACGNITKAVQGFLICYDFDQDGLDSIFGNSMGFDSFFGSGMEEAVKKYQKSNNLEVDGYVGKKTIKSMTY